MNDPGENAIPQADLQALTQAYLEAFDARDLERCLGFFSEDATIDFQSGFYHGRKAIEEWHQDRFAANLRIIRLESITVRGDTVIVDAVARSDRLAAWKINALSGRLTIRFEEGKIKEGKLAPRMMNPIDLIRSGQ